MRLAMDPPGAHPSKPFHLSSSPSDEECSPTASGRRSTLAHVVVVVRVSLLQRKTERNSLHCDRGTLPYCAMSMAPRYGFRPFRFSYSLDRRWIFFLPVLPDPPSCPSRRRTRLGSGRGRRWGTDRLVRLAFAEHVPERFTESAHHGDPGNLGSAAVFDPAIPLA